MNNLSNMIKVAVVGGEGIGPEVTAQSHRVLNWFAAKRAGKVEVMAKLRADYEKLKATWDGHSDYDNWFKRPLNNAHLNTVATYQTLVPAFQQLLAQNGGDLPKFYAQAKSLAALPKEERLARMADLTRAGEIGVAALAKPKL